MAMLLPSLLLVLLPPPDASAALNFCCYIALSAAMSWLLFKVAKIAWPGPSESRAGVPPGNRGLPLIGETLQFMAAINSSKGFYDFVRVRSLRHGNCFKTSIFGETHVFVSSTESAKAILNNDAGRFTKRYIRSIAEIVGEESVLCASKQQHRLIRGRLASLFSTSSLGHFIKQFDGLIVSALDAWEHKGTVIVLQEALRITFKAMCKMLISLEGEEEEMLGEDVGLVCEAMLAFPLRLPWTRFRKGLQARARIMGRLEKMINERRRGLMEAHYEDFLQQLLMVDEKDSSGSGGEAPPMSDAQIKDNILTMIIAGLRAIVSAGQDTTASAITWMVKYLDDNQDVLHTLKAEQLSLAERTPTKTFLALEDLNDMPYASKVIKESLRMASIVPWFPRLALEDTEIHGYKIKKGWSINIDARSIHLDPTVYYDPNKFIPSRFDDDSKPYSFLAFGQGGRTCLGMNLARAMMLVFLHRLVTTYKWQVIDQDLSVEKWALFSRLKSGCPITVKRIKED